MYVYNLRQRDDQARRPTGDDGGMGAGREIGCGRFRCFASLRRSTFKINSQPDVQRHLHTFKQLPHHRLYFVKLLILLATYIYIYIQRLYQHTGSTFVRLLSRSHYTSIDHHLYHPYRPPIPTTLELVPRCPLVTRSTVWSMWPNVSTLSALVARRFDHLPSLLLLA